MKKTLLLLLLLAPAGFMAQSPSDTIHYGQGGILHFSDSYQRCSNFSNCPWEYLDRNYFGWHKFTGLGDSNTIVVNEEFTTHRLPIRGIVAMVARRPEDVDPYGTILSNSLSRVEEYLSIYQGDSAAPRQMTHLATARMSEEAVYMLEAPQCEQTMGSGDSSKFLYCHLHEARFERPVVVDSTFYVGGTLRNNGITPNGHYAHLVTLYVCLFERYPDECDTCLTAMHYYCNNAPDSLDWAPYGWTYTNPDRMHLGPFIALVDTRSYTLSGVSDSVELGSVTGSGTYRTMTQVAVEAVAAEGARFSHWTDLPGELAAPHAAMQNPRVVELYYDSTVTAHFTTEDYRYVSLATNNPAWGSVAGGGEYRLGATALLTASATEGYQLLAWSDGNTVNSRMLQVDDDTALTAIFVPVTPDPHESISQPSIADSIELFIMPNPTHDRLTVKVSNEGNYLAEVYTMSGHEVYSAAFTGNSMKLDTRSLAQGAYLLVVSSDNGKGTARFIKQ